MVQATQTPEEGRLWNELAETPSTAIVLELMHTLDREVDEIPPLARTIDPDAIDRLVESGAQGTSISFTHAGCAVTVSPTKISVSRPETPPRV
ncbi:HalOD1 output domain-containing protein [Halomicroarcula sp. GCM10025709]|uniref:HalOD1 output domain-containing protein n=1 Tax=Haloarcula TaxID=2237 RepID=UPI0024C2C3FF|nr:HalOD1 output domain-containing protein [Halomicroarcula sp. YJ-61-S]